MHLSIYLYVYSDAASGASVCFSVAHLWWASDLSGLPDSVPSERSCSPGLYHICIHTWGSNYLESSGVYPLI